jgi:predicted nucleotide-binding protein
MAIDTLNADQASSLTDLVGEKIRKLESIRASLNLYEEPIGIVENQTTAPQGEGVPKAIFLVHGRDTEARLEVQRVLERATSLDVIVLANQPNQGQTIVEKLESHFENSAFAVVLMTADDQGRLKGTADLLLRARQNVILELGYATAKLGRRNIAVLYEDGIEIPSDYLGVGRILFDAGGGWKLRLLGELKSAGIDVDPTKLL